MAEFQDTAPTGVQVNGKCPLPHDHCTYPRCEQPPNFIPSGLCPETRLDINERQPSRNPPDTPTKLTPAQQAFVTLKVAMASGELTLDDVLAELSNEKIAEMQHILRHLAF